MEIKSTYFDSNVSLQQQRELFKECFPETYGDPIQNKEHYLWKFHSYPSKVKSWEYSSFIGDEMVAYYAAIPYSYKIGHEIATVGMVCDVMTSTKYRGKGIFTKLGKYSTNELAQHIPFSMGYPIRKEVIPGHLKVGWKIAFKMPLFIRFLKFNSLLRSKKLSFFILIANPILFIYKVIVREKVNMNYTYNVSSDIESIPDYEAFSSEWGKSVKNTLIKDLSFAKWRYNAPQRSYKFLTIYQNGKLIGFLSFRKIIRENVPSFGILDYMVLPGYEDCHGLINKVLNEFARKDQVEAILVMMSNYSANKYRLYKNGFLKSPFFFSLIIKNLNNYFSNETLLKEENWHLMWIDSDDL